MSPRVAYLLEKFPRLSQTSVLNELLAQERLGRELFVFSRRTPDDEPRHAELGHLRATIERLPSKGEIDPWKTLVSGESDPDELLGLLGGLVREMRTWERSETPPLLVEALHLFERARALGIQHVHVHGTGEAASVALLMQRLGGPSYSLTARARDIHLDAVALAFLEVLVSNAAFAVTVCDADRHWLSERLPPAAMARVRRLYDGIDLTAFVPDGAPREPNHVLGVGRLVEKKGFHVLVEALDHLLKKGVDLHASLIGDGVEKAGLERLIAERGIGARVKLLGPRDRAEIRRCMSRATILVHPCRVGQDGDCDILPTVLLESLAMHLPSVTTRVSGIPEILDNGRCGVMVPENDVAATAAAIEVLLRDPSRRASFAVAGRRRAQELFDAEKNARILASWFDEAVEAERPAAEPVEPASRPQSEAGS